MDATASPSYFSVYFRLLKVVRPYGAPLALAVFCMIVLAGATGVYAYMVGPLLKFLVSKGGEGGQEILTVVPRLPLEGWERGELLMVLPLVLLAVALVKGVSYFGQFYLMGVVGQRVVADLRQRMFDKLTCFSQAFYSTTPTGQIISRFTSDVLAVEQAVTFSVAAYLRDSMQVVVLTVLAFVLDWQLAFIAFVVMPLAIFPIVHFGRKLRRVSTDSQVQLGSIADRLHESIKGMRMIQVFGQEGYERRRFGLDTQSYLGIMQRSFAVRALQSPIMEVLGAVGLASTIWYAGSRMMSGTLDPGHFVSFFASVIMLYNPIKSLGRIGEVTSSGVAAAQRLFEFLDLPVGVEDRPSARELSGFGSAIEFQDVRFSYGEQEVLQGVSFQARRGEVLALVGPSGAGKSTLVHLIPRFFDVTGGQIQIDGSDIRDFTLASLRRHIGIVTQDVVLFNDTVWANIAYGCERPDSARLRDVAHKANALDFIEALPQQFETRIGEGGIRLSGGQRQRIAIARALWKDAPILILDEATSSLDSQSECEVQAALESLMTQRTTLVIAHRLSTILRSDRILVLENGRIVEQGKHGELLSRAGLYHHLYELQFQERN